MRKTTFDAAKGKASARVLTHYTRCLLSCCCILLLLLMLAAAHAPPPLCRLTAAKSMLEISPSQPAMCGEGAQKDRLAVIGWRSSALHYWCDQITMRSLRRRPTLHTRTRGRDVHCPLSISLSFCGEGLTYSDMRAVPGGKSVGPSSGRGKWDGFVCVGKAGGSPTVRPELCARLINR
jgi:hypothetical protein